MRCRPGMIQPVPSTHLRCGGVDVHVRLAAHVLHGQAARRQHQPAVGLLQVPGMGCSGGARKAVVMRKKAGRHTGFSWPTRLHAN